jgi:glycosyltransferase involved in cell wall biosynthesis
MKVLIVSHVLAREIGGGVRMRAIAVARALVREGVDVHLLGTDAGMTPADAAATNDLAGLPVTLVRSVLPRFAIPLRAAGQVARLVRDADVVLLFNHWTLLNASAYRAARRHGVPHVICPSGALTWGARSHLIKRVYQATVGARLLREAARCIATTARERGDMSAFGVPDDRVVVIPNAIDPIEGYRRDTSEAPDDDLGDAIDMAEGARTDAIDLAEGDRGDASAAPDGDRSDASEAPGGLDALGGVEAPGRIEVPDGVAALRERLGGGDAPLLLFMGRLNPIKGADLLLDAFARIAADHPAYRLVFAGRDEGMQTALAARADALGLRERVRFAGMLDRAETAAAYRAAALLIVPSRQEAMSLVALEAGIEGTPVMMTDVCGFDDLERSGGGLLVPPTVDGLTNGLRRLLASPAELPRMGRALRAHVLSNYRWPSVAPRWVSVLTAAVSTRPRDSRSRRNSARMPA